MSESIAMSAPDITEEDVRAVAEVVRSGRLALGPKTEQFEQMMADYVGVKHAVAVSSGTTALHLIVSALEIGPGDSARGIKRDLPHGIRGTKISHGVKGIPRAEVLVPSFTFASSVNVVLYQKATPVFVDIEADTYNLDPEDVRRKITSRTRAIMAVDVFGHPAEWDALSHIAEEHDLMVIDDSCEALGARYKGRKLGTFGDASAFAFYPNKQMTTGEGGIIVTDSDEIASMCRSLRNQGRGEMGAWLEHERLGYNYRMTEMSAALGVSQLKRIDAILEKRAHVASLYTKCLAKVEHVSAPVVRPEVSMSWFVYVITLEEGLNRDVVMRKMVESGIPTRGYFSPMHLQPYIRDSFGTKEGELPATENVSKRTIALPFHSNLSEDEVGIVVEALAECVKEL
jgi:perosamine synthetase